MKQIKSAVGLNLAIKEEKETRKSAEGFIYSTADEKKIRYKKAKVIAVGNDVPAVIEEGDTILYDGANGSTAMIGSEPVIIILYRDVSLVLSSD